LGRAETNAVGLSLRACLGWLALVAALVPGAASAQHITIDGTLSPARTLAGPRYLIGANLGRQVGGNLFESFGIFGLTAGERATFTGPASIANVIGRVTGGEPSSIDGAILSKIAGANVYLINPWGVIFGTKGSVNVTGSFYASTANYLRAANGARFQATHPGASTLTAAPPAAFGFLGAKPAAITVDGSALTARGTIGLVGGAVSVRDGATIKAAGGTIDVLAAAGKGEAPVNPRAGAALTVSRFGRVNIAGGSSLEVGNASGRGHAGSVFVRSGSLAISASTIEADNYGAGRGGVIVLLADGRIALAGGTVLAGNAGRGNGDAGDIIVKAGSLSIESGGVISAGTSGIGKGGFIAVDVAGLLTISGAAGVVSGIGAQANSGSTGNAGDVFVRAGKLSIGANGEISAGTFGSGAGGDVLVDVAGLLTISGAGADIDAQANSGNTFGSGHGGIVAVRAGALFLEDGAQISVSSFSAGTAGEVSVQVAGSLTIEQASGIFSNALASNGEGAGRVTVVAGSLSIDGGGQISAGTWGTGKGGDISVEVSDRLTINGAVGVFTGIAAQANSGSTGRAGDITVTAGTLFVADGGQISGNTFGTGHGGIVTVRAGALFLKDGAQISVSSFAAGAAGEVSVQVAGSLTIEQDSGIFSNALASNGEGAGRVTVAAGSLSIDGGGQISAGTWGTGKGGDISVDVSGRLTISGATGVFTGIAAQANSGSTGRAGDVTVTAGTLAVVDRGEISAATFGAENAGTVTVHAGILRLASNGEISADSAPGSSGNAGDVTVEAETLQIDDGLISSGLLAASNVAPASTGRHAGTVIVEVAGLLTINGARSTSLHGIAADANRGTTGTGGNVRVTAGELRIVEDGEIASGTFGAGKGGNVSVAVAGRLTIDGRGANPVALTGISSEANPGSKGSAGNVTVRAGDLVVVDGGAIADFTFGAGNAGNISVRAGTIYLARGGNIASDSEPGSSGNAGNVIVKARTLAIEDGLISSSLLAAFNGAPASTGKQAGEVTVEVSGLLTISGAGSRYLRGIATDANRGTTGSAGNVLVTAGALSITDKGEIASSTFGAGNGGNVTVEVAGRLAINGAGPRLRGLTGITAEANPGSKGSAGNVAVTARTLAIVDAGEISSGTFGSGNGGNVVVDVAGRLTIDGRGSHPGVLTGITSEANSGGRGNAGNVTVTAGTADVVDGGEIVSTTAGSGAGGSVTVTTPGALLLDGGGIAGTEIAASATGAQSGPAGTVTVSAGSLTIAGGAEIASTAAGLGPGGGITVSVSSDIVLTGPGAEITAQSTGRGNAGTITISASRLFLDNGAAISTEAETATANGGNISLTLGDRLFLTDSKITTSVHGETGNGGNISLTAPFVILDHGEVIAQAIAGHGGDIMIDAGQYIPSSGSLVSASSALGVSGNVVVSGPRVDLNGTLVVLSSELRNPAALTRDSCAAQAPRPQSSLVEAGRGGLPEDPNATLPALYLAGRDIRLGPPTAVPRADKGGDLPAELGSRLHCG
jgi:filamentous hemagglutinin family protein